jgi:hypothetical protein
MAARHSRLSDELLLDRNKSKTDAMRDVRDSRKASQNAEESAVQPAGSERTR